MLLGDLFEALSINELIPQWLQIFGFECRELGCYVNYYQFLVNYNYFWPFLRYLISFFIFGIIFGFIMMKIKLKNSSINFKKELIINGIIFLFIIIIVFSDFVVPKLGACGIIFDTNKRDTCYFDLAIKTENENVCSKLSVRVRSRDCYLLITNEKRDITKYWLLEDGKNCTDLDEKDNYYKGTTTLFIDDSSIEGISFEEKIIKSDFCRKESECWSESSDYCNNCFNKGGIFLKKNEGCFCPAELDYIDASTNDTTGSGVCKNPSKNYLIEYYCSSKSTLMIQVFNCPNGCNDGACIN
ncbi:MAG: hypothetical protein AABX16_01010 [Nanoarchaeota archaeon]